MSVLRAPATTATLNKAIAGSPAYLHPMLVAVRDHRVGMLCAWPDTASIQLPKARSLIALLGDDLDRSAGPDGFHGSSLRRLIRRCGAFAVVSSEPVPALYAMVASAAVAGVDAMLVETRIEHEFQWVSLIRELAPGRPLAIGTIKGGRA